MTTLIPQCFSCKRLEDGKPMHCKAFPDGIPDDILYNEFDHRKPHDGDHGIQFEANKGEESPFVVNDGK